MVFTDTAPAGSYGIWVENYEPRSAGTFRLEVAKESGTESFTGSLPAEEGAQSEHFTFTL